MSAEEQAAARARFAALFDDCFAAPRREDLPQIFSPEKNDADLHRDVLA